MRERLLDGHGQPEPLQQYGANFDGGIYNLSGALFSLQNDQAINLAYGYEYFNNAGTVRKSVATGTTTFNVVFNNSGTLDVQSGTVSLNGGGALGGGATVAAGAGLVFGAGSFVVTALAPAGWPAPSSVSAAAT